MWPQYNSKYTVADWHGIACYIFVQIGLMGQLPFSLCVRWPLFSARCVSIANRSQTILICPISNPDSQAHHIFSKMLIMLSSKNYAFYIIYCAPSWCDCWCTNFQWMNAVICQPNLLKACRILFGRVVLYAMTFSRSLWDSSKSHITPLHTPMSHLSIWITLRHCHLPPSPFSQLSFILSSLRATQSHWQTYPIQCLPWVQTFHFQVGRLRDVELSASWSAMSVQCLCAILACAMRDHVQYEPMYNVHAMACVQCQTPRACNS